MKSSTWRREGQNGNTDVTTNIFAMVASGTFRAGFVFLIFIKSWVGLAWEKMLNMGDFNILKYIDWVGSDMTVYFTGCN